MANGYTEEQVRLAGVFGELKRIREACTDLYNLVDFTDATRFEKEDNQPTGMMGMRFTYAMAYGNCLARPSATSCAYVTEAHLRQIRADSRAFSTLNPYWMAIRENKISYAIGTGHVCSVVPKRKSKKVPDELSWKVLDELEQFQKLNHYRRRQGEKLTRLDRDGEFFLRYFEDRPDGILRVRFIEPLLIQDPPSIGPEQGVWFGIQFDGVDYEEPIGYYVRPSDYLGGLTGDMEGRWRTMIPAADIQHRTVNVDIGSPRGLPSTYSLQEPLVQALSTLKSMGKLVDIRARLALVRKQVNATLGQIQPLLNRTRAGQTVGVNGTLRNAFELPYGTIMDTNDQRTYEFPSQNIETDKIVHSLKADLQGAAAAMGIADFTISGDSSAAFANALVKEGPMDRAIGRVQQDMIDDDLEVYERALRLAADRGRLPGDVLETVRIEIMPPGVIARERLVNTQADEILVRNGAMSSDTMAMRANLDPEDEREKAKENPSPQVAGNGDTRSNQPGMAGKATARGVPSGAEPGPDVNPRTAESLEEGLRPTNEDMAMASLILTDEWHRRVKDEILTLPSTGGSMRSLLAASRYEPGVDGILLGRVDDRPVWVVDMLALLVRHGIGEWAIAGSAAYWDIVPDTIVVDWAFPTCGVFAILYHEAAEFALMERGKWSHSRANRMATYLDREWLKELRPELAQTGLDTE